MFSPLQSGVRAVPGHAPFNEHDLFWNFNTLVYQALVD
jgi:hypothetical protein